jgi:CRP-like cAMP-binding protein
VERTPDEKSKRVKRTPDAAGTSQDDPSVLDNRLVAMLHPVVVSRLKPALHRVQLERNQVLFRPQETLATAYFPVTAVVSFVAQLETGEQLEVGMVGRDGLAGTAVFPGISAMSCEGIVQIPGLAHSIDADMLRREVLANESLYSVIGRYAQVLLARSMQMSICNMFHSVEQRCIRWLLSVNDLIGQDDIPLTHELMATMLGVHRPTVTVVLRTLHHAALVEETRGRIVLLDRARLESACCECYGVMQDEQRRLLGTPGPSHPE